MLSGGPDKSPIGPASFHDGNTFVPSLDNGCPAIFPLLSLVLPRIYFFNAIGKKIGYKEKINWVSAG